MFTNQVFSFYNCTSILKLTGTVLTKFMYIYKQLCNSENSCESSTVSVLKCVSSIQGVLSHVHNTLKQHIK